MMVCFPVATLVSAASKDTALTDLVDLLIFILLNAKSPFTGSGKAFPAQESPSTVSSRTGKFAFVQPEVISLCNNAEHSLT
ncbi:MAG: hypothetical protein JWR26_2918 [Pedosphaera sp.]|nr:hypothetical protein [Pedosphaera sp.]